MPVKDQILDGVHLRVHWAPGPALLETVEDASECLRPGLYVGGCGHPVGGRPPVAIRVGGGDCSC